MSNARQLAEACRQLPSLAPQGSQAALDHTERDRWRQLGADCLESMLALPEEQRYEAIAIALNGARLYRWLQATSSEEPDWVALIEEQFCRYGALWIKDQGRSDPHLALRALPLIDRLLQFHPTQHDWISATRQQLEQAAAPIPRGFSPPPTGPAPFPWPEPLHTYRLSHRLASNAVVLPIGVIADGEWFCDCLQYLPASWPEAHWMQQVGGYQLERDGDSISLRPRPDQEPSPLRLEGTWCVLNDIVGRRNLGHFFHDTLPQLAAIRRLSSELGELKVLACRERYANLGHLRRLLWPGEVQLREDLPASFTTSDWCSSRWPATEPVASTRFQAGLVLCAGGLPRGGWSYFAGSCISPRLLWPSRISGSTSAAIWPPPPRFPMAATSATMPSCWGNSVTMAC